MNLKPEPLAFELSSPGRVGVALPKRDVPAVPVPEALLRDELKLPAWALKASVDGIPLRENLHLCWQIEGRKRFFI